MSARIAIALLVVLCLPACGTEGGSTTSTTKFRGVVRDARGEVFPGVSIMPSFHNDSAVSDAAGVFSVETLVIFGDAEFVLAKDGVRITVSAIDVPLDEDVVELEVTFDTQDPSGSNISIVGQESPGPEPVPGEPGAETPDSTPEPNELYDENGNTTSFGIPPGLVGNISRGRSRWNELCIRCHTSERGRRKNFRDLKRTIADFPMFITVPDARLADIVAYLNRTKG